MVLLSARVHQHTNEPKRGQRNLEQQLLPQGDADAPHQLVSAIAAICCTNPQGVETHTKSTIKPWWCYVREYGECERVLKAG